MGGTKRQLTDGIYQYEKGVANCFIDKVFMNFIIVDCDTIALVAHSTITIKLLII